MLKNQHLVWRKLWEIHKGEERRCFFQTGKRLNLFARSTKASLLRVHTVYYISDISIFTVSSFLKVTIALTKMSFLCLLVLQCTYTMVVNQPGVSNMRETNNAWLSLVFSSRPYRALWFAGSPHFTHTHTLTVLSTNGTWSASVICCPCYMIQARCWTSSLK